MSAGVSAAVFPILHEHLAGGHPVVRHTFALGAGQPPVILAVVARGDLGSRRSFCSSLALSRREQLSLLRQRFLCFDWMTSLHQQGFVDVYVMLGLQSDSAMISHRQSVPAPSGRPLGASNKPPSLPSTLTFWSHGMLRARVPPGPSPGRRPPLQGSPCKTNLPSMGQCFQLVPSGLQGQHPVKVPCSTRTYAGSFLPHPPQSERPVGTPATRFPAAFIVCLPPRSSASTPLPPTPVVPTASFSLRSTPPVCLLHRCADASTFCHRHPAYTDTRPVHLTRKVTRQSLRGSMETTPTPVRAAPVHGVHAPRSTSLSRGRASAPPPAR